MKPPTHPTRPTPRAHGARSRAAATLLVALCASLTPAQPTNDTPATPQQALTAQDSAPADRAAAATAIIRLAPDQLSADQAAALLTPDNQTAATALLAALRQETQPLPHWFAPTADLARGDSPLAADAIAALGSFRTRDSAAVLVEIVADSRPPARQQAAARALTRLSGRTDLSPSQWRQWLADSLTLTERQWEQRLLQAHIHRVESLRARATQQEQQLADAWRRVHLLTPVEQRSDLLAQLLESHTVILQDLGFELVNREIGEGRQLKPAVAQAAIALLRDPEPGIRAQAAILLDRLAPPDAGPAVLAALERESDPIAADALLRAAARWPGGGLVKPALRWINDPALRLRAAATAWSLLRDSHLTDESDRQAVLDAVRQIDTPALSPPACRILATLGDQSDLARLHALLTDPEPAKRTMAADALALRADQTETLLAAANTDATLFEPTARALRTHLRDARGYDALSRLPSPSPQVRARVLADHAAILPTAEIIRLARLTAEPADALLLLRPLTAPERIPADDQPPTAADEFATGLLLLARTAAALGNPTEALNALTLIPEGLEPDEPQALTDLRVTLLLWLNRLEEAAEPDSSPEAWLQALEHTVPQPHARAIADAIAERFPELSEDHTARLETLRQRLAEASVPAAEDG